MSLSQFWLATSTQLILAGSVSVTSYLQTIVFIHVEVTSYLQTFLCMQMWRHIYSRSDVCTQRWRHASVPRAARLISGSGKEIARFHILRRQKLKKNAMFLSIERLISDSRSAFFKSSKNDSGPKGSVICRMFTNKDSIFFYFKC